MSRQASMVKFADEIPKPHTQNSKILHVTSRRLRVCKWNFRDISLIPLAKPKVARADLKTFPPFDNRSLKCPAQEMQQLPLCSSFLR